jgi:hypothetical protein
MQKWNGTLLRKFDDTIDGNASVGTTIVVRNTGSNTIAVIYDVDDANSVQKNNPFVTDDFGRYSFYAPNGKYTIEFGDGSDSIEISINDLNDILSPFGLESKGNWASGQVFDFYNQYMIYNGEAYSPLPATTLPYTVGTIPNLGFVYQIQLNDHSKLANRNAVGAHSPTATGSLTPRTLEDRFADVLNVKDFGADASGLTDSSPAIQAAIHYAETLPNGGSVYIPTGTYLIGTKLLVTSHRVSIKGQDNSSTLLIAAQGLDYIIHIQAQGSGSYINRYLDGANVSDLQLSGAEGEHITTGIFCNGVYNSQYYNLRWINLDTCVVLDGTIKCLFDNWFDGDREPAPTRNCNYLVRSAVLDKTTERDNTFSHIVMTAKLRHMDFNFGSDGVNILNNIFFVNGTDCQQNIRIKQGLYSTITGNKCFESRGEGILLDSCAHVVVSNNLIAIPGQGRAAAGISLINSVQTAGHAQEITIVGNSINQSSGNGIEIYGHRAFNVSGNTIMWAGFDGRFNGGWGNANSIVIGDGCVGGTITDNQTSFKLYADKVEYSRTTYDVLLEQGSFGCKVEGHLPYYIQDFGVDNLVINRDGDSNLSNKIFDESARNMIRNSTYNMTGWVAGNDAGTNPVVTYNQGATIPSGRSVGGSTVAFPNTNTSQSYIRAVVGSAGLAQLPALSVGDKFICSVFMKSNSGAMRKITLQVEDQSGAWNVAQVFNVGTEYKRFWMIAEWNGAGVNQIYFKIMQQKTFSGTIFVTGAKVEIISKASLQNRAMPSPVDYCHMYYTNTPSAGNGGDIQQGDRFSPRAPTSGQPSGLVATASGTNTFTLASLPVL